MPLSDYFTSPTSFRNAQAARGVLVRAAVEHGSFLQGIVTDKLKKGPPHSGHPNFAHLILLVFEAVLEVVCVSLPGYIVARQGMFDAESQKFLANMNVMLFTPCLIFTKLASQLTAEKLVDLAIIPIIFVVQTIISYICAYGISKCFGFKKRQRNFIIAMGVFGNSNSLPISLVISLSQTLKGLHWDKVPGDNDEEVGARGILYLLIFQQLGQLLRWSWGYNVLLAPADKYLEIDGGTDTSRRLEQGSGEDAVAEERRRLISPSYDGNYESDGSDEQTRIESPTTPRQHYSGTSSSRSTSRSRDGKKASPELSTPANGSLLPHSNGHITSFPDVEGSKDQKQQGILHRAKQSVRKGIANVKSFVAAKAHAAFSFLPAPLQKGLSKTYNGLAKFFAGLWEFMNPPLWAMLIAIVVASIPDLQRLFFDDGTFIRNSVTRAIGQSGGVAVPLILVVLGGNLARNTLPKESQEVSDPKEQRNLLIASLVSRMVLPTIIMAPFLALGAKYIPVSIVDDKIFIIVCFLLTGAPTALQLAQICQVNNVYMGVMSKILFQSYVVWILPSTLILVLCALETVEWAER